VVKCLLACMRLRSFPTTANGNGAVSDQKIFKSFVSRMEQSMAGHVGVNGVN
jgi:hypothetical protein